MNTMSVSSIPSVSSFVSHTPQIIPTLSVSSTSTASYYTSMTPSVSPIRPPTVIIQENNITIRSDYVYGGAIAIGLIFIILIANIIDLRKKLKLAKITRSGFIVNPASRSV